MIPDFFPSSKEKVKIWLVIPTKSRQQDLIPWNWISKIEIYQDKFFKNKNFFLKKKQIKKKSEC